jgi:outer membrane protein assembly factor BamB
MTRRTARGLPAWVVTGLVVGLVSGCSGAVTTTTVVPGALPVAAPASGVPVLATPPAHGWPQALRDGRRSGTSTSHGPSRGTVRWKRTLDGPVVPGPVVAPDGTIYAADGAGVLHALDPLTGAERWKLDTSSGYGDDLTTSPALLADGTIVWPGGSLKVYGVSPQGRLLWTIQRRGNPLSPAVVSADSFYLSDSAGRLAAYRIEAGRPVLRWDLDLGTRSYGSPAVAPDGSIRATVDNAVVAVRDLGDRGEVVWRADTGDLVEVSAAVAADGTTLVGSNTSRLYALDQSGQQRWSVDLGSFPYSSPVADGHGHVWIGTNDGLLVGVDVATGRELRRVDLSALRDGRDGIWSSPVVDDRGTVYVGMLDGSVHGVDGDGAVVLSVDTGTQIFSTGALTDDGAFIVGNEAGVLTAID